MISTPIEEQLLLAPTFRLRRGGRFLVADLLTPHRVLSTSAVTGGQQTSLTHLLNHQSCEGAGHAARHEIITAEGPDAYHAAVCREAGLDPARTATLGTAANMHYAALVTRRDEDRAAVTAVVTAGVQGNGACAGDPAAWREGAEGWSKVHPAGTINTLLLFHQPLTAAALARAVITATEAKSAALARLAVPSLYSADLATGTGTDQFALASPLPAPGQFVFTSTSPHGRLGELIATAVRDATLEALRWQNGLEPSLTRGLFHALGRYGVKEPAILDDLRPLLSEADLTLLARNANAVFYEPLVAANAYALAAVLDRLRYGVLAPSVARVALRQQAASLAAALAARPGLWPEFWSSLPVDPDEPKALVLAALAAGWSRKWT